MKTPFLGLIFTLFSVNAFAAPIVISCWRGPTSAIIWDKPNFVFTESLKANGYNSAVARNIGNRICRDPKLVGKPKKMKAALLEILAQE